MIEDPLVDACACGTCQDCYRSTTIPADRASDARVARAIRKLGDHAQSAGGQDRARDYWRASRRGPPYLDVVLTLLAAATVGLGLALAAAWLVGWL